jgi:hypothetical protein
MSRNSSIRYDAVGIFEHTIRLKIIFMEKINIALFKNHPLLSNPRPFYSLTDFFHSLNNQGVHQTFDGWLRIKFNGLNILPKIKT